MTTRPPGSLLDSDPFARVSALAGVSDAVAAARSAVDALLRHRILRRRSAEVTAEASLRAARASAALEGHNITLESLRAHLLRADLDQGPAEGDMVPASGEHATAPHAGFAIAAGTPAVALGATRLYAGLATLAPAWERAPRQALARMHVLAARGIVTDSELGRPALGNSGSSRDTTTASLGLPPAPPPAQRAARLDGLTSLLVGPTSAPAIVVAAIVHGELLALRPFGSLDGVVARAAARLVLVSRGLDPKAVTAGDVGHLEAGTAGTDGEPGTDGAGYARAARGYVDGGPEGVRRWVEHCSRAVELGARESLAICEALARSS